MKRQQEGRAPRARSGDVAGRATRGRTGGGVEEGTTRGRNSRAGLRSHCPVNYGLEAFGDRWALLILRDIVFRGKRTYGEFLRSEEGFSTNILAARLQHLVESGILRREPDEHDGRREIYALTEKGLDLIPVLFEIVLWSARYDPGSEARRITRLVERIRKDNRRLSAEVIEQVRRGEPLLPRYLDPTQAARS